MRQCDGEERSLHLYWYTSWPDQKTPDKAPPLLELVQQVERARDEAPPFAGPTVVHCRYSTYIVPLHAAILWRSCLCLPIVAISLRSAGIGRTGCFIATSILCKQLRTEGVVDILRTMCQLRLDRWRNLSNSINPMHTVANVPFLITSLKKILWPFYIAAFLEL